MHHTVRRRTALAALALAALSPLAQAQAPAANVRLLVGYAAGGPVDAPTDPVANADCSTSSAKYHNPS